MYESLAYFYDTFMEDIPYEKWAVLLKQHFEEHGIEEGIVLDLGCGTGVLTRRMSSQYDMIGVDNSPDMLQVANENSEQSGILYLCQDMRELDLYGTISAAYSMCDSLNYITKTEDLVRVMDRVSLFMEEGGIFVFDMRSVSFYRDELDGAVFYEQYEDADIVWENEYDPDERLHEYFLTIYEKQQDGSYIRQTESHVQRAYSIDEVKEALSETGFTLINVMDEETGEEASEKSRRLLFVARTVGLRQRV